MRRANDSTRPASRAAARRLGALAAGTVLLAACGGEGADPEGAAVVAATPAPTAAPTSPAAPSPTIPTATTDRKPTTTDEKLRITTRPERSTTTAGRRPRTSTTTAVPAPAPPPPPPPAVVLPQPIDPPDDAEAFEPVVPLGTLAIPTIGLQRTMYEGIRLPTFDLGPGHWPGSAMPGQQGNMIVGGHRTSGNADFRYLDALVPGDEMIMTTTDGAVHTYRVDGVEIVDPFALRILEQTPATTATLFACHPPGSIRERIVVHLSLSQP